MQHSSPNAFLKELLVFQPMVAQRRKRVFTAKNGALNDVFAGPEIRMCLQFEIAARPTGGFARIVIYLGLF
ncbi:hypothetical protein [uncultured Roseovarius sp.]|uniref:hypothetical protein n=1 Tax=uncultured Roseovarius sp. TaxID=293344 RepID=UPI0026145F6D|nr:hypothetical protein [uncultured Roseovarius sp.]